MVIDNLEFGCGINIIRQKFVSPAKQGEYGKNVGNITTVIN